MLKQLGFHAGFNATNTASFDIPLDDVTQNENFNDFPVQGTQLYNQPFGLGVTNEQSAAHVRCRCHWRSLSSGMSVGEGVKRDVGCA